MKKEYVGGILLLVLTLAMFLVILGSNDYTGYGFFNFNKRRPFGDALLNVCPSCTCPQAPSTFGVTGTLLRHIIPGSEVATVYVRGGSGRTSTYYIHLDTVDLVHQTARVEVTTPGGLLRYNDLRDIGFNQETIFKFFEVGSTATFNNIKLKVLQDGTESFKLYYEIYPTST